MNYEHWHGAQDRRVRFDHCADGQEIAELGCAFPEKRDADSGAESPAPSCADKAVNEVRGAMRAQGAARDGVELALRGGRRDARFRTTALATH